MTVIITGQGTGILNSSLETQGIANTIGNPGAAIGLNLSNGNVIYQQEDSLLVSQGADFGLVRTYNARARMSDDSGFGDGRWRLSTAVSLKALSQRGETYYEITWGDGSVFDYRFDAATATYISTDGSGAYGQLTVSKDGQASLVQGDQSRWTFDLQGRLKGSVDTNGNSMAYEYGADGLKRVIDDSGHVVTFNYTKGLLASVVAVSQGDDLRTQATETQFSTVLVTYSYDLNGRLSAVTDRRGDVTRYEYTETGLLKTLILPQAYQDSSGVTRTDKDRSITLTYQTVRWVGDIAGPSQVVRSITQGDQTTTIDYDFELGPAGSNNGEVFNQGQATVTDYLGHQLRYRFDSRGNVLSTVDQLGYRTRYRYDANDNLLSVTDRNGWGALNSDSEYYRTLRYELGFRKIVNGVEVGKSARDLTEDDQKALREAFTSYFTYDKRGNLTISEDNSGNVTTYTYTSFNKIATIQGPPTAASPAGALTRYDYDAFQNLIRQTDPSGDITEFEYTLQGNLSRQTRYLQGSNRDTATEAQKQVTEYSYDQWGNNTQTRTLVKAAEGTEGEVVITRTALYDHFGNVLSVTDGEGSVSRFTYDGDNRLLTTTEAAGTALERTITNVYDAVGNRIALTTEWDGHTITQVYDQYNRLLETLDPSIGGTADRTTRFVYRGNAVEETNARGNVTTYTYNGRRELVEIMSPSVPAEDGTTLRRLTETLAYDAEGNRVKYTDARGYATLYVHDQNGQLSVERQADGHSTRFTYDANRNVMLIVAGTQLDEAQRQRRELIYDQKGQLITEVDGEGHSTHYDYDEVGNVIRVVSTATNTTKASAVTAGDFTEFKYDLANRQILTTYAAVADPNNPGQTVRYTESSVFDGNGNMVGSTDANGRTTTFSYDALYRQFRVTDALGTVTEFGYDSDDNVTRISVTGKGDVEAARETLYGYNEFNELVSELDGVGNALLTSDSAPYQRLRLELGYSKDSAGSAVAKLAAELTDQEKAAIRSAFSTQYRYDQSGNVERISEANGRVTSFRYDALNRLVRTTNASTQDDYGLAADAVGFNERSYRYDGNGNVVAEIDERGNAVLSDYDVQNRLIASTRTTAAGAEVTEFAYDDFGNIRQLTEAKGSTVERVTQFDYDLRNLLTTETQLGATPAANRSTGYTYDHKGNRLTLVDARTNTTRFGYDALNRLISVEDALGYTTEYGYDGVGNQISVKDPRGNTAIFTFNAGNELVELTDAEGRTSRFTYDALGNTVTQTTGVGTTGTGSLGEQVTRYEYDAESKLRAVETLDNQPLAQGADPVVLERTEYGYDSVYNLTEERRLGDTPEQTAVTGFTYDVLNRLITSTDALGYVTMYTYDETGNVLTRTDPAAPGEDGVANVERKTEWQWDAANRMLSETDAAGTVTQYAYNVDGSVAAITTLWQDELGAAQSRKEASYRYDAFGNIQEARDANNNPTTYVYDDNGNVIEQRIENGNNDRRTSYSYNSINQQVAVTEHLSDTEPFTTRMAYDANGYQSLMIDANGVPTAYFRNNNGEVLFEVDALGNAIGYEYDDTGNVVELRRYANTFPAVGKVSANALPPGVAEGIFLTDQPYLLAKSSADQVTQYQYDARNLLSKTTDTVGTVTTYTYDAVGNLQTSSRQGLNEAAYQTRYTHDLRDQLTLQAGEQGEQVRLAYDALGNVIESEQNELVTRYTFDVRNQVKTAIDPAQNTQSYDYDVFGNVTRAEDELGVTLYRYDALNRLQSEVSARGYALANEAGTSLLTSQQQEVIYTQWATQFAYDAVGNLLSVTRPNNQVVRYQYDALGRNMATRSALGELVVQRFDAVGNLTQKITYDHGYAVGEFTPRVSDVGETTTYACDDLNRLDTVSDNAGVVTRYGYDDIVPSKVTGTTTVAVSSIERANGRLSYDADGRLISSKDALGVEARWVLNGLGNIVQKTEAFGTAAARTTYYKYDQGGARLRAEITPVGRITLTSYDGESNRVTRIAVYDATETVGTTLGGEPIDLSSLDLTSLDGLEILADTSPLRAESWEYYQNGNQKSYTNSIDTRTEYTWQGELAETITYAVGTDKEYRVSYTYYEDSRLKTQVVSTDRDVETQYFYDENGNITKTIEAVGLTYNVPQEKYIEAGTRGPTPPIIIDEQRTTLYVYDDKNRLIKATDATGRETRYFYDRDDRLAMVESPDNEFVLYIYNAQGQLEYELAGERDAAWSVPDGEQYGRVNWELYFIPNFVKSLHGGIKTSYTYDALDPSKVATKTTQFADGSGETQTLSYTYDALGRDKTLTNAEGYTTTWVYDDFGNIAAITVGEYKLNNGDAGFDAEKAALADPQSTNYHFDAANNVVLVVDRTGSAFATSYDVLGNVTSRTTGIANQDSNLGVVSQRDELRLQTYYEWYADGTLQAESNDVGERTEYQRDALGRATQVNTLQSNVGGTDVWSRSDYVFDALGNLVREIDDYLVNNAVNYQYDAFGNVIKRSQNDGYFLNTKDDGTDSATQLIRSVRLTDGEANIDTYFTYDALGRVASSLVINTFVDKYGAKTVFTYDAVGNLVAQTERNLNIYTATSATDSWQDATTRYYHDEYGQITGQLDATGFYTSYSYDAFGNQLTKTAYAQKPNANTGGGDLPPVAVSSIDDRTTIYSYDGNNRRLSELQANGLLIRYQFDSVGQLRSITKSTDNASATVKLVTADLATRVTKMTYDGAGRLLSVSGEGTEARYTYDAAGNKQSEKTVGYGQLETGAIDPDRTTIFSYYANGLLQSQTTSEGNTTAWEYDLAGNMIQAIDANGNTTLYRYYTSNLLAATVDAEGYTELFDYDGRGNLFLYVDKRGARTWYDYNQSDQLVRTTSDKDANLDDLVVVRHWYDLSGNKVKTLDERGFIVLHWYDAMGQVTSSLNGDGVLTQLSYNAFGEVEATQVDRAFHLDWQPGESSLQTTDAPVLSSINNSTNAFTTWTSYDGMGNVIKIESEPAEVTRAQFNSDGSVSITSQASETIDDIYSYDIWGNQVIRQDGNGWRTYGYYDTAGRNIMLVNAEGFVTESAYDSQGNVVTQIRYRQAQAGVAANASPNMAGKPVGARVERVYDADNRLVEERSGAVNTSDGLQSAISLFIYDDLGNLVKKVTAAGEPEEQVEHYGYDCNNRLIALLSAGRIFSSYRYDENGNVLEQIRYAQRIDRSEVDTLLASRSALSDLEPAVFNRLTDQKFSYVYNAANWLIRETEFVSDGVALEKDSIADLSITKVYGYDQSGNQVTVTSGNLDSAGNERSGESYDAGSEVYSGSVTSTYNASGWKLSEQSPVFQLFGVNQHWEYNTQGQALKVFVRPESSSSVKGYDLDSEGNIQTVEYVYGSNGALLATNEGDGLWREFAVDAMGNVVVTYLYGSKAAYAAKSNPLVSYTFFNGLGDVERFVDSGGRKADETLYDFAGRIGEVKTLVRGQYNAGTGVGRKISFSYDSVGNLMAETDALGSITQHQYDLLGNRLRTTYQEGNSQVWIYDDTTTDFYDGQMIGEFWEAAIADPITKLKEVFGTRFTYTFDSFGRRLSTTANGGQQFSYDNRGRIVRIDEKATGTYRAFLYDFYDNQIGFRDGNGNYFLRLYNNNEGGSLTYSFVEEPGTSSNKLDNYIANNSRAPAIHIWLEAIALARMESTQVVVSNISRGVADVFGRDLGFYDAFGRLLKDQGSGKRFEYDQYGRFTRSGPIALTDGLGNQLDPRVYDEVKLYDSAGNLVVNYNPSGLGNLTRYSYNDYGELISEHSWIGADFTGIPSTDAGSLLNWVPPSQNGSFDPNWSEGETKINYDANGDVVSWSLWSGYTGRNFAESAVVTSAYDGNGRIQRRGNTSYSYDGANRLSTETSPSGVITYSYNANGQVSEVRFNGAPVLQYIYSPNGLLANSQAYNNDGEKTERGEWAYDGAGNPVIVYSRTSEGDERVSNTYDKSNRIIRSVRVDKDDKESITETTYGNVSFSETPIREVVVDSTYTYTYEFDERGIRIFGEGSGYDNGESLAILDRDGRTVETRQRNNATQDYDTIKRYVYDPFGRLLFEAGAETQPGFVRYFYVNGEKIATETIPANGAAIFDAADIDALVEPGDIGRLSHSVGDGDTLRSLALRYYGSQDLWYVIAEANGLPGGSAALGSTLSIPPSPGSSYFNAESYSLARTPTVNASSIPTLSAAATASESGLTDCELAGVIAAIVVVAIVAAVATVLTVGAAAPVAAAGIASLVGVATLSTAATVAVGVAVGVGVGAAIALAASALTQGILVGTGLQTEFDWSQVAADTLVGGLAGAAAGLGGAVNSAKAATTAVKIANVTGQLALDIGAETANQSITKTGVFGDDDYGFLFIGLAGLGAGLGAASDALGATRKAKNAARIAKLAEIDELGKRSDLIGKLTQMDVLDVFGNTPFRGELVQTFQETFTTENLEFLQDVRKFKFFFEGTGDVDSVADDIARIQAKYGTGGGSEINVAYKTHKQLADAAAAVGGANSPVDVKALDNYIGLLSDLETQVNRLAKQNQLPLLSKRLLSELAPALEALPDATELAKLRAKVGVNAAAEAFESRSLKRALSDVKAGVINKKSMQNDVLLSSIKRDVAKLERKSLRSDAKLASKLDVDDLDDFDIAEIRAELAEEISVAKNRQLGFESLGAQLQQGSGLSMAERVKVKATQSRAVTFGDQASALARELAPSTGVAGIAYSGLSLLNLLSGAIDQLAAGRAATRAGTVAKESYKVRRLLLNTGVAATVSIENSVRVFTPGDTSKNTYAPSRGGVFAAVGRGLNPVVRQAGLPGLLGNAADLRSTDKLSIIVGQAIQNNQEKRQSF
jgi:YD repeat-containing protein